LIAVTAAVAIVIMLLLASLTFVQLSGKAVANQLVHHGQALNTAAAGLAETLSWFRRQTTQPVTNFDPALDPGDVCSHTPPHNPPVNDTDNPAVGIVRSFQISTLGRVWGQYEVRRTTAADTAANRNMIDVSLRRGHDSPGIVWQVESNGIVFVENEPFDSRYTPDTDFLLSQRMLRTEIFRFTINRPAESAVCAEVGNRVSVLARGTRIRGGNDGYGVAYATGSAPSNPVDGTTGLPAITGTPANITGGVSGGDYSIDNVFGVSEQELTALADDVVTDVDQLPAQLPDMGLIVIRGNATFTTTRPLNGSGVLIVLDGTLTIPPGTLYNGFIYVRGDYNQSAPSLVSGGVLVKRRASGSQGNLTLTSTGDFADIFNDSAFITQILQQMGRYRFSRSTYIP
jgi:hypothetical protein